MMIIEGNLMAVKDQGDFGGPNMWDLYIQNTSGGWDRIQWMSHSKIQSLFKEILPVF